MYISIHFFLIFLQCLGKNLQDFGTSIRTLPTPGHGTYYENSFYETRGGIAR